MVNNKDKKINIKYEVSRYLLIVSMDLKCYSVYSLVVIQCFLFLTINYKNVCEFRLCK